MCQYVDAQQLDFFNEAEACSDASAPEPGKTTPVKAHARKAKRTKEELTEGLEHKKVVCELPEQEQICAKCGSTMVRIGEKFVRWITMPPATNVRTVKPRLGKAISGRPKLLFQ